MLEALLAAHEVLAEALKMHNDLQRVGIESEAREREEREKERQADREAESTTSPSVRYRDSCRTNSISEEDASIAGGLQRCVKRLR